MPVWGIKSGLGDDLTSEMMRVNMAEHWGGER